MTAGTANRINNTPEANAAAGFEDLFTSGDLSTDSVVGTAGSNRIFTGFETDVVNPQGGADNVGLGSGNDAADTRDGFSDRVQCGAGADTVAADQFDELTGCETVTVTEVRPAGADLTAPACAVTRVKKRYRRKAFLRGITARVRCNEISKVTMQIVVGRKSKKRRRNRRRQPAGQACITGACGRPPDRL